MSIKKKVAIVIGWLLLCVITFSGVFIYKNKDMFKNVIKHVVYMPEGSIMDFIRYKNLRIFIFNPDGFFGEYQTSLRMCKVLKKAGYCPIYMKKSFLTTPLLKLVDIDLSISFYASTARLDRSFNYLILHKISQIPSSNTYRKKAPSIDGYDGILSVIPVETIKKYKNHPNIIPFFLSAFSMTFCDSPKTQLFFGGFPWDEYRAQQIENLYHKLDATDYFYMYGPEKWRKLNIKSYRGLIPFGADTVLKTMQKHGITLVIHSEGHFKNNIPTSRIFEAAAASCVIICDRLPFIVDNFGDSVLYIDRDASPEEMFKQIDNHMKWILSHQREAIELARRSHKIFTDKFTLEQQMQNVIDNYKKHVKNSNK